MEGGRGEEEGWKEGGERRKDGRRERRGGRMEGGRGEEEGWKEGGERRKDGRREGRGVVVGVEEIKIHLWLLHDCTTL